MKKILFLILLISTLGFAGEINDTFNKINKEGNKLTRIEMKLDLIINQYINEEKSQEEKQEMLDSTIEKTKSGFNSGVSWIKEKTNKMMSNDIETTEKK